MPEPKPMERAFVLRIPESYALELDGLVEKSKGKIKSRNDLITDIISTFLTDLHNEARKKAKANG